MPDGHDQQETTMKIRSLVFDHHRHSPVEDDSHLAGSTITAKVAAAFPGAVANDNLVKQVSCILRSQDYRRETTLLGSSLCCDEVCRSLEHDFATHYGSHHVFKMGGLAGFPFGGPAAFRVMLDHITMMVTFSLSTRLMSGSTV
jgi:hypothetical protein